MAFHPKVVEAAPDECWPWEGYRLPKGYGQLRRGERLVLAHRAAWEDEYGEIPDGMQVLHRCDNPPCCNPAHLFLGTATDNVLDRVAKDRDALGESGMRGIERHHGGWRASVTTEDGRKRGPRRETIAEAQEDLKSFQVVPDLSRHVIDHGDREVPGGGSFKYKRRSIANARVLYYIAEHDREGGVSAAELMRELNIGVMQQGHLALSMKDSVRLGYVEQVAARGEQYRWRITSEGLHVLGMPAAIPDADRDEADDAGWNAAKLGDALEALDGSSQDELQSGHDQRAHVLDAGGDHLDGGRADDAAPE